MSGLLGEELRRTFQVWGPSGSQVVAGLAEETLDGSERAGARSRLMLSLVLGDGSLWEEGRVGQREGRPPVPLKWAVPTPARLTVN